ncbi:MAG: polysaccharide biosynthesis/export family protein [Pseudomonadota bacterium]
MRNCVAWLIASAAILFVSGCAGSAVNASQQELPIPDTTTSVSMGDLRIGALDLVQIEVFGVDSLNGTYQVSFDGTMKLPLIGEVDVIGQTPSELSYELEKLYENQYLQNPNVSVVIVESVGRRITLDGAVRSPGLYPVTGSISLLQAVALGGGPDTNANPRKVVVFRQIDGSRHAAAFDLVSIRNGKSEDPMIYGNDIIVVDGSNINEAYSNTLRSIPLVALFLAF